MAELSPIFRQISHSAECVLQCEHTIIVNYCQVHQGIVKRLDKLQTMNIGV